jgi:hypothetical protein
VPLRVGQTIRRLIGLRRQKRATEDESFATSAVGEEAEVPDLHKSGRENVVSFR